MKKPWIISYPLNALQRLCSSGWSQSSLGEQIILLLLSCSLCCSFNKMTNGPVPLLRPLLLSSQSQLMQAAISDNLGMKKIHSLSYQFRFVWILLECFLTADFTLPWHCGVIICLTCTRTLYIDQSSRLCICDVTWSVDLHWCMKPLGPVSGKCKVNIISLKILLQG